METAVEVMRACGPAGCRGSRAHWCWRWRLIRPLSCARLQGRDRDHPARSRASGAPLPVTRQDSVVFQARTCTLRLAAPPVRLTGCDQVGGRYRGLVLDGNRFKGSGQPDASLPVGDRRYASAVHQGVSSAPSGAASPPKSEALPCRLPWMENFLSLLRGGVRRHAEPVSNRRWTTRVWLRAERRHRRRSAASDGPQEGRAVVPASTPAARRTRTDQVGAVMGCALKLAVAS